MKIIAEFNDKKGFNVKLTEDKIYVSAIGNEETIALRSVNGVGLYDDINKYDEDLKTHKQQNSPLSGYILTGFGVVIMLTGLIPDFGDFVAAPLIEGISFITVGFITVYLSKNKPEPKLDSYFKFMLSGGSREFKFDKSDDNSSDVANFINKVEETLTAYN
jgi:hypothetical protein